MLFYDVFWHSWPRWFCNSTMRLLSSSVSTWTQDLICSPRAPLNTSVYPLGNRIECANPLFLLSIFPKAAHLYPGNCPVLHCLSMWNFGSYWYLTLWSTRAFLLTSPGQGSLVTLSLRYKLLQVSPSPRSFCLPHDRPINPGDEVLRQAIWLWKAGWLRKWQTSVSK